jgi:hypothetical protein
VAIRRCVGLWVFLGLAARRAIRVILGMVLVGLLFLGRRVIRVIRALRVGMVLTVLAGRRAMPALLVRKVLTAKTVLLMSIRWRLSTFSMMTLRFWLLIRLGGLLTAR